jgi:hypothetical protein
MWHVVDVGLLYKPRIRTVMKLTASPSQKNSSSGPATGSILGVLVASLHMLLFAMLTLTTHGESQLHHPTHADCENYDRAGDGRRE